MPTRFGSYQAIFKLFTIMCFKKEGVVIGSHLLANLRVQGTG
jgi:hypothetical protein